MAEALAIIGLTSALVQFLDFGTKVIRQLRRLEGDMEDMPLVFRNVRSRLPLMLDVVRKLVLQVDAGMLHQESQETMLPVVRNCVAQAEHLDSLISRALPTKNESVWSRGKKAVIGVIAEPEIERIDAALKINFDLLAQSGTFQLARNFGVSKSRQSMFDISGSTVNPTLLQNTDQKTQDIEANHLSLHQYGICMAPFPRDANFLGRNSTLELIQKTFDEQSIIALSGLGGIGKSQIAIEYCYIFKEKHPDCHVFWVWGGNHTRFEESYRQIARKLSIPGLDDHQVDILQLVKENLNTEQYGKWLLILDNADEASMYYGTRSGSSDGATNILKSYARYLPNNPDAFILITTRDRRVGERLSGRNKPIEVTSMTVEESKELLQSKMSEENWVEADAARLVEELSRLPLAITQAAAFISENNLTIAEYLETLSAGDEDIKELLSEHLEDPRRDLDTENSVIRTWKLSFDQIAKGCPRAAEILSLMSALDWHLVPLLLLRKEKETETGLRTALGALQAFSLVNADRGKDANCKMHRLVALSTQKWLEMRGDLSYWQSEALSILSERFPGPGQQQHSNWHIYDSLMPHALLVLSYLFSTTKDLLQCAKLSVAVALYSLSKGKYSQAFEMSSRSLEIRQTLLTEHDPAYLDSVQTLGEVLLHRGELQSAKTMLNRAVTGREMALGPKNTDTLESLSDLTLTLLELDDLPAAEKTCLRALNGRREVLGEEDADTLVSLNIMAILRHRQGDLVTAKQLYEKVLERREGLLGYQHPDTLMTLNNLARLYYEQDDLDAAQKAFGRVLEGEDKELGSEGYDIQVSLSNMALVLAARGEFTKAQDVLLKVLGMRQRQLGSRHPSWSFTIKMIADIHEQVDDLELSGDIRRRVNDMKDGKDDGWAQSGALLQAGILFD